MMQPITGASGKLTQPGSRYAVSCAESRPTSRPTSKPTGTEASATPQRLRPELFKKVQRFIYDTAGIDIPDGKEEMVSARLWKQTRLFQFATIEEYLHAVEGDDGDLLASLVDSLTTNYTSFFREPAHFDFLRQRILPGLASRGHFTIWSAASSTGEEPYSIAITLREELGASADTRASVLGTDISTRVLKVASQAVYGEERFRSFGEDWKRRWLLRGKGQQAGNFQVRPEVRRLVEYRRLNLMEALPPEGPFPLIFLRNIMIYFDRPTQEKLIRSLSSKLEAGGYLFIGHSESLNGIDHGLEHAQVAIYRKPLQSHPPSNLQSNPSLLRRGAHSPQRATLGTAGSVERERGNK